MVGCVHLILIYLLTAIWLTRGDSSKVKVKWSHYRSGVAQRVVRAIVLFFHDRGTRRGEWSAARPGRFYPRDKTRYPFYRRLDGHQGRVGRAENLVPTGIRSRTVQPVVIPYTDWDGGSSAVHIYTQTKHRTTQLTVFFVRLSGIRTQIAQTKINAELTA